MPLVLARIDALPSPPPPVAEGDLQSAAHGNSGGSGSQGEGCVEGGEGVEAVVANRTSPKLLPRVVVTTCVNEAGGRLIDYDQQVSSCVNLQCKK